MKERIQKVIAEQGFCSRRAAEQLIREGRVMLNGRPVCLGDKMDILRDHVSVDGQTLALQKRRQMLYYLLHKPRGYVTTLSDRHAAKTIMELIPDVAGRVYPVGRLDKDSEGLLLLTNDGELANRLTSPKNHIGKLYRVTVRPAPTEEQLIALSQGVTLNDGYHTGTTVIRVLKESPERGVLEFTLYEGKNRQIRRMCEAVDLEVARLKRIAIGPLRLGMLQPGQYRALRKEELLAIRNAIK